MTALQAAGCVFAEEEAAVLLEASGRLDPTLGSSRSERLATLLGHRCAGQPLEYVVGWADFAGHRIELSPGVFIPRRRSELLAVQAIARLPEFSNPVVLDLCCGSGALGFAVASGAPPGTTVELHASDIDPSAVTCARVNLARLSPGPRSPEVHLGALFDPLPARLRSRVDLLLANAPYVPSPRIDFLPVEARSYEPRGTLDGGPDGLDVHRLIAERAAEWLSPGGALLIETSEEQAEPAAGLLTAVGLSTEIVVDEEIDATVVIGSRRLATPPLYVI